MTSWQGPKVTRRGVIGAAATVSLGGCGLFDPDVWTHRARLTLSINTPNGPRQASTVVEAQSSVGWAPGIGTVGNQRLRGQAAFLDMGGGRHLIMLLGHDGVGQNQHRTDALVFLAFRGIAENKNSWDPENPFRPESRPVKGVVQLRGLLIPTIGRFRDLNDPFSWETVYWVGVTERDRDPTNGTQLRAPYVVIDNIASIYGQGHSFGGVTLEIVNAGIWPLSSLGIFGSPISTGIEEKVPWLKTGGPVPWDKLPSAQRTFIVNLQRCLRSNV